MKTKPKTSIDLERQTHSITITITTILKDNFNTNLRRLERRNDQIKQKTNTKKREIFYINLKYFGRFNSLQVSQLHEMLNTLAFLLHNQTTSAIRATIFKLMHSFDFQLTPYLN